MDRKTYNERHQLRLQAAQALWINADYRQLVGQKFWFETNAEEGPRGQLIPYGFTGVVTGVTAKDSPDAFNDSQDFEVIFIIDYSSAADGLGDKTEFPVEGDSSTIVGIWNQHHDHVDWTHWAGGHDRDGVFILLADEPLTPESKTGQQSPFDLIQSAIATRPVYRVREILASKPKTPI